MSDFDAEIIEEFRTGDEPRVGPFPRSRLVILHTVGARTGTPRETPLMSFPDGEGNRFIVASKAGADDHPEWFHNLIAANAAVIEVADGPEPGVTEVEVVPMVLPAAERERVYADIVAMAPTFGDYERRTDRVIPVVKLIAR